MRHGSHPSEICKADPRATPLTPAQKARGARCVARVIVRRINKRPPVYGACNQPAHWLIAEEAHCTKCAAAKLRSS